MRSDDGSMKWVHYPEYWHIDTRNNTIVIHEDAPAHVVESIKLFKKNNGYK